jgi:hypothetical protein
VPLMPLWRTDMADWITLPPGTVVEVDPATREALASAVAALTAEEVFGDARCDVAQFLRMRERIAEVVRTMPLTPLLDEYGNVVGHLFRED